MRSRIVGASAGTALKSDPISEVAWYYHRISFFVGHARGKDVLDLGCVQHRPENYSSKFWVHKALVRVSRRVVGLDLYEEGVRFLQQRGYNIVHADACNFDLGEKFDVIVAGDIIEHVDNVSGFFLSCARHLKSSGVLLITTDNPWFWKNYVKAVLFGRVSNNPEHVCWYDPVLLHQVARRFGFCMEENECVYGAREWYLNIMPLPCLLKYPTFHSVLRQEGPSRLSSSKT